jgi:hypothetical protein
MYSEVALLPKGMRRVLYSGNISRVNSRHHFRRWDCSVSDRRAAPVFFSTDSVRFILTPMEVFMSDPDSSKSTLLEKAKKNPALTIIAIVLVVMFVCAFLPLPLPCAKCEGTASYTSSKGQYKETIHSCNACKRSGYQFRTVWSYMNT